MKALTDNLNDTRTDSLTNIQKRLHSLNPETSIIAVSKLQSVDKIRDLWQSGQKKFAENYVQEAQSKQVQLRNLPIEWHFIGRLQRNKVKFVVGHFALIHSVDSVELAAAIDKKAADLGLVQPVLLQMNLANEDTKGGFTEKCFEASLSELQNLKSIQISGLMTMPPLFENPEESRPFFRKLFNLKNQFLPQFPHLKQLSMGTSSDFLVAAEEGSTLVRLGTILFGERPAKNG